LTRVFSGNTLRHATVRVSLHGVPGPVRPHRKDDRAFQQGAPQVSEVRVEGRRARLFRLLRENDPQELILFERLRDAFRAALDAASTPDLRSLTRQMREAVVDAKVAVQEIQEAVTRTERELAAERQRLADAERRSRLAGEIQDQETVAVADRFAGKHRERAAVLERKLAAEREELALAQRELEDMQAQLKAAGGASAQSSTERAWRDLEEAGGAREGTDLRDELLKSDMDRAAREAAAARQLEELKKKMRKD